MHRQDHLLTISFFSDKRRLFLQLRIPFLTALFTKLIFLDIEMWLFHQCSVLNDQNYVD